MGREKFLLDLAWLIVVGAVLVFGDYRRRDEQNEIHSSFKLVRTIVGARGEASEASLALPLAATGRRSF